MSTDELEAIRQRRMAELSQQYGGKMPASQEELQEAESRKQAQEEQRAAMLASVLQPAARERLSRIALVKPEKARGVENLILSLAQRGQLTEPVSDTQLLGMLEKVNEQMPKTGITINRRRPQLFEDD